MRSRGLSRKRQVYGEGCCLTSMYIATMTQIMPGMRNTSPPPVQPVMIDSTPMTNSNSSSVFTLPHYRWKVRQQEQQNYTIKQGETLEIVI